MKTENGSAALNDRAASASVRQAESTSSSTKTANVHNDRSQRKRDREKQRRCDVNKALDRLAELIFRVDPKLKRQAKERREGGTCGSRVDVPDNTLLSQVELVKSAVATLERVHNENEEHGKMIARLSKNILALASEEQEANSDAACHPSAPPLPPARSLPNPMDGVKLSGMDVLAAASAMAKEMNPLLSNDIFPPEWIESRLGAASATQGHSAFVRTPLDRNLAEVLRGHSAVLAYQATLDQEMQQANVAAHVAARLGTAATGFPVTSLLSTMLNQIPAPGSLPSEVDPSLHRGMIYEQTIAQLAAFQGKETAGYEDCPAAKKLKLLF